MPFLPADHSKGDANTIGGYMAVHARPAAFEGSDGCSYSVDLAADETDDPARPWGGYIVFVRWHARTEQGVAGHLETDFLAHAATEAEAIAAVGRLRLGEVRAHLERLIAATRAETPARPWWESMRDEGSDGE